MSDAAIEQRKKYFVEYIKITTDMLKHASTLCFASVAALGFLHEKLTPFPKELIVAEAVFLFVCVAMCLFGMILAANVVYYQDDMLLNRVVISFNVIVMIAALAFTAAAFFVITWIVAHLLAKH